MSNTNINCDEGYFQLFGVWYLILTQIMMKVTFKRLVSSI